MTRIPSLALPGRIASPEPAGEPSPLVPMGLPPLRELGAADGPRLSIALMDGGGRLQDRGAVAALGREPGDRLLITVVKTSVVIREALAALTGEPHPPGARLSSVALCDSGVGVSTLAQRHGLSDPQAGGARWDRDQVPSARSRARGRAAPGHSSTSSWMSAPDTCAAFWIFSRFPIRVVVPR